VVAQLGRRETKEAEMTTLTGITGLDEADAQKLKTEGISSAKVLMKQAADPRQRKQIAAKTGISNSLILDWFNHAGLREVKGVGAEYANLLKVVGVRTFRALARRNPRSLHRKMVKVNRAEDLVRKLPSLAQVEDWVAQAKRLRRRAT